MGMYFLNENGDYYETVTDIETNDGHTSVPQRPSADHQWQSGAWVEVTPDDAAELAELEARTERDQLLLEMDAVLCNPIRWASFDDTAQAEWATYRQELLDVPQQAGFPDTITWPTEPS